ncbi:MAG TPA: 6,7-dimethyl-8-ribityllumazine synthase [Elusimicrobiota bacterium]|jgi:6,7-dimethyl-8-ribityllumazine synthase|nr:6,7-dimethyl-8-ribityllumazine synthase [Elusimicrobiota bacterium]
MSRRLRFGIAASRFNSEITDKLLASCRAALKKAGVADRDVEVVRVPGAFELPWAVQELARSGEFHAVIALGAVLQGETPQNDYISEATYAHVQRISLQTRVPCVSGVITPRTYAQAVARTKGSMNRGAEAAHAALEMAALKADKPWKEERRG